MPDTTRTTTTVAIVSDTHGQLDKRIADIVKQADIAVHAGDIGDASVLEAMQPKSGQVYAVAGNNDHPVHWPAIQSETLKSIPQVAEFDLPVVFNILCHFINIYILKNGVHYVLEL